MKKRVTGTGGIFFKTENPEKLKIGIELILALNQINTVVCSSGGIMRTKTRSVRQPGVLSKKILTILDQAIKSTCSTIVLKIW